MQSPIAPASDAIFNAIVYTNGQLVSSPHTTQEWGRLRAHTESLRGAAQRMMPLAPRSNAAVWIRESAALDNASVAAMEAIDKRSVEGVLDAGGKIYATCTTCHEAYVSPD